MPTTTNRALFTALDATLAETLQRGGFCPTLLRGRKGCCVRDGHSAAEAAECIMCIYLWLNDGEELGPLDEMLVEASPCT